MLFDVVCSAFNDLISALASHFDFAFRLQFVGGHRFLVTHTPEVGLFESCADSLGVCVCFHKNRNAGQNGDAEIWQELLLESKSADPRRLCLHPDFAKDLTPCELTSVRGEAAYCKRAGEHHSSHAPKTRPSPNADPSYLFCLGVHYAASMMAQMLGPDTCAMPGRRTQGAS